MAWYIIIVEMILWYYIVIGRKKTSHLKGEEKTIGRRIYITLLNSLR